jgi:ribonuclease P protein component
MFPAPNRLPSSEIKTVLRSRNRVSGKELQIIFDKSNLLASRFAVIVSTKIDKRATARNRIKRLVRESVRHILPQIAPGWDCVVMARANFADQKQPGVEKTIQMLLHQAGLIIS